MEFSVIILAIIFVALIAIVISEGGEKHEIKKAGKQGEKNTGRLLSALPDSYKIIQNVTICAGGKKSELDNIVVGKTGVFIIETKNHKGCIVGDCQAKKWSQQKIGRGGTPYSKELYNPTKQVATHIYTLKQCLIENKAATYISGAVYFANPEASIKIANPRSDIPVFKYRDREKLLNYILTGDERLSDNKVNRIVDIILSESK